MNPGPLVSNGDMDQALAGESTKASGQKNLFKEAKERNNHAGEMSNRDPEDDERGEHGVADILKVGRKTDQISHNLNLN